MKPERDTLLPAAGQIWLVKRRRRPYNAGVVVLKMRNGVLMRSRVKSTPPYSIDEATEFLARLYRTENSAATHWCSRGAGWVATWEMLDVLMVLL